MASSPTVDAIPEDVDCVMIYAPASDISQEERDLLADYAAGGGKLFTAAGPVEDGTMETLWSLLADYGVEVNEGIVVEEDREHYSFQGPASLLPDMHSDSITDSLLEESYHPVMPISLGLTVTLQYAPEGEDGGEEECFVLHVSPDPEDGEQEAEISAYVRIGESQIIYKISAEDYEKLSAASYDELRHREVLWADFEAVEQIDILLEGDRYTLAADAGGSERSWLCQGEEVEITGLQESLEALTADEFTGERPTQKEEIRLTVHLDHENFPEVEIVLYRYDGSRCLAEVDGQTVSLVERASVVDLIEAVHAIVLH